MIASKQDMLRKPLCNGKHLFDSNILFFASLLANSFSIATFEP